MADIAFFRKILGSEVEARPNQPRPYIISDRIGLGPMGASRLLGVIMLRIGSNRRGISSQSWRSRKNTRRMEIRPARVFPPQGAEVLASFSPGARQAIFRT